MGKGARRDRWTRVEENENGDANLQPPITNTFMIHETHCCHKNSFGGKGMATGETMGYVNWLILDYLMESRLHFSQTSGIEELALTTSIGSSIA